MAETSQARFNSGVLHALREQVSLSLDQVAKFTSIPLSTYEQYEVNGIEPSAKDLNKLAKFYRTSPITFYRSRPPTSAKRIDFRRDLSTYRGEPGPVLDAISTAMQFQKLLLSVVPESETWRRQNYERLSQNANVEDQAQLWRRRLSLTDDVQLNISNKSLFFSLVRSRIESLGIGVIVDSYPEKFIKGMAISSESDIPVILVNSYKQQKSSRTFTLVHEFAHVLLGRDDISNPYEPDGALERFCNKFAASLLMPVRLINELVSRRTTDFSSNAGIKWLANKLKVSMEAVVIRLQDCQLVKPNFWSDWKAQFAGRSILPSEEPEGGGGAGDEPVDQGLVKLAKLGFLLALSLNRGLERSKLSGMAVYKTARLKPHYFAALEDAAKNRLAEFAEYAAK